MLGKRPAPGQELPPYIQIAPMVEVNGLMSPAKSHEIRLELQLFKIFFALRSIDKISHNYKTLLNMDSNSALFTLSMFTYICEQ